MLDLHLVAFVLQKGNRVRRDSIFHANLVRQPLMVEAGCIHRFLNIQTEIDHSHQHVGDGRDNGRAAGRTQHQKQFAVFEDDGGRHRRQRALAGANRVRRPLDEAISVRHALLGGEVVHFVVEQEAEAFDRDARSQGVVQSCCHSDRIAGGIDHRVMGSVFGLANNTRPG